MAESDVASFRSVPVGSRSVRFMEAIGEYIERNDVRGASLSHSASDVLDGWAVRSEVDDLIRRKLLRIVNLDGEPADPDAQCGANPWFGTSWTVCLTERAIRLLWPDRRSRPAVMRPTTRAA